MGFELVELLPTDPAKLLFSFVVDLHELHGVGGHSWRASRGAQGRLALFTTNEALTLCALLPICRCKKRRLPTFAVCLHDLLCVDRECGLVRCVEFHVER